MMRSIARIVAKGRRLCQGFRGHWTRAWLRALYPGVAWDAPGRIASGCRFALVGEAKFRVGAQVDFAETARIVVRDGLLEIGARSFVGIGAVIVARDAIRIGQDVLIAEYVTIRDQDHLMGSHGARGFATAPIEIEDGVWLGAKATITRGVRIGARAVIGANAVVTRDIPAGAVAGGAPARILKPAEGAL